MAWAMYECWLEGDIWCAGIFRTYVAESRGNAKYQHCLHWSSASGHSVSRAFRHVRCRLIMRVPDSEIGLEGGQQG